MKTLREFLLAVGGFLTLIGGSNYVFDLPEAYKIVAFWLFIAGVIILLPAILLFAYHFIVYGFADESEPRSYVVLAKATLKEAIVSGDFPIADLLIKNIGQVPASNLRITFGSALLGGRERKKAKKGKLPKAESGPFSGGDLDVKGGMGFDSSIPGYDPDKLTAAEIASIVQDEQTFYVWGEILYDDMSRKNRSSKLCAFINDIDATQLILCSKGNQTN